MNKAIATPPGEETRHVELSADEQAKRQQDQARHQAEQQANAHLNKRLTTIADGGYGSTQEQLEILGEQGIEAFQAHIAAVKAAHPKP